MATKAKTTSRASSAKTTRPAAAKAARTTTKKTEKATVRTAPVAVARPVAKPRAYSLSNDLSGSQVVAEMIGTFLLVAIVSATGGNAFLVGIALVMIVSLMFNISGAHVNPAVTFGFFVMRKISAVKMLFYWMAQFVGSIAAILAVSAFSGSKVNISLVSFMQWDWRVVFAELIGATIFMFAIAAAVRRGRDDNDKALTIGLALFVALLISGSLLQQAIATASSAASADANVKEAPRITKLSGTTLNPAVALSLSETNSSTSATGESTSTSGASRFTVETILGTLLGAAIGGRLYMLIARGSEENK